MRVVIEKARSERTICSVCGRIIYKGEKRLLITMTNKGKYSRAKFVHFRCIQIEDRGDK